MLPDSLTMFVIRLLVSPALFGTIFFIFGKIFTSHPPKTINLTTGYRTVANQFAFLLMTRMGSGCIALGIVCALSQRLKTT